MKYRSTPAPGDKRTLRRVTLHSEEERELLQLASDERRSIGNMISVLVAEALAVRRSATRERE